MTNPDDKQVHQDAVESINNNTNNDHDDNVEGSLEKQEPQQQQQQQDEEQQEEDGVVVEELKGDQENTIPLDGELVQENNEADNGEDNGEDNEEEEEEEEIPLEDTPVVQPEDVHEDAEQNPRDSSEVVPVVEEEQEATTQVVSMATNNNTRSTLAFLKQAFQDISSHKEIKSSYSNTHKLLEKTIQDIDIELAKTELISLNSINIFEALRSACRTKVISAKVKSLDGLSKLFSFQLLDEKALVNPPDSLAASSSSTKPASASSSLSSTSPQSTNGIGATGALDGQQSIITPPPKMKLVDAAIDTITDCFEGEVTDERVELQIIKCLTSCILMEDSLNICHGQSLLKAIRTIYNIFIFSLNSSNQTIAQATLIQVVNKVFERVGTISKEISNNALIINTGDDIKGKLKEKYHEETNTSEEPLTLNKLNELDVQQEKQIDASAEQNNLETDNADLLEIQLAIKDAFLVFRSMAKISVKNIEETMDIRSHAVRSKLLSLHIIHSIIRDYIDIFLNHNLKFGNEIFVDSIRQYLCLSISRNSTSPITPVYEITLEIMWLLMSNLRHDFKREIPVFLTEIYLPIADMKTSTTHQKRYFLNVLKKLCNDPRIIIEFYLNYDCDSRYPNLLELIVDYLSRMTLTRCDVTELEKKNYLENLKTPINIYDLSQLPLLSISNLSNSQLRASESLNFPVEYASKMSSLECVVALLRSLSSWAHKSLLPPSSTSSMDTSNDFEGETANNNNSLSEISEYSDSRNNSKHRLPSVISLDGTENELQQFENSKIRKTLLTNLISTFNKKPKKGIPELISHKFIEDDSPVSIARFLLSTDGLDLATVGDFLGEGADKNIAIMHAFVEELNFENLSFIEALRIFLQKFRLPGEGQKIDRFMLKFAERFVEQNPSIFAKADTAYVLAYSVIMLNTDLHSPQIKHRMTLDEFLDNTAGINDGQDLPKEYVVGLYKEIENNEIKLLSEQHDALLNSNNGAAAATNNSAFNFFNTRDLNREAYMQVSKEITTKTENVVKNLSIGEDEETGVFYVATHVEHVKFVFETLWMSFLASLTSPFKECDDSHVINLCLEGLQISVRISATFGIEMARTSFIGALIQFTNLQNVSDLKKKNIDAVLNLLEVSLISGNFLKDSWKDILFVVSQVERLQLIAKGIDKNTVPDVSSVKVVTSNGRASMDSKRSLQSASTSAGASGGFFSMSGWGLSSSTSGVNHGGFHDGNLDKNSSVHSKLKSDISKLLVSGDLFILVDKVFSDSCHLSAPAIIDFIKALTQVCIEEIESSSDATQPRMFSLQKMIDVCYYNMNRIRVEWTPIWNVMGSTFIQIATNQKNLVITFFAIDSLRQLSMRFLNIEELQGFEFQCDFLKPFVYILKNSFNNYDIQEMCLECFNQFILIKGSSLKSGWKPILESLQYVSEHTTSEKISNKTLDIISLGYIKNENFINLFGMNEKIDNFLKYIYVYKEICKNARFPKNSLRALNNLKSVSKKVENITFKDIQNNENDDDDSSLLLSDKVFDDVWYPIFFTYNDIIMNSKDMEVRSCCLNELFEFLSRNGKFFSIKVWEKICNKILFPIFSVLQQNNNEKVDKFNSHDDLSVWLNTTLIQALRNTIALFTHYYDRLEGLFGKFLDILVSCICQENDTIARIGRTCLQQLIIENIDKYDSEHWDLVTFTFNQLFEFTTAVELFYDYSSQEHLHKNFQIRSSSTNKNNMGDGNNNLDVKNVIVIKCVLQLMVIELLSELFENEKFINTIPNTNIMELIKMLEKSYGFSRKFNDDYELRTNLVEMRIVDKIPNLLKQESSSAAVLMSCLFRLYFNNEEDNGDGIADSNNINENGVVNNKNSAMLLELFNKLLDISLQIIQRYNSFDDIKMDKNIIIMTPVIIEILQGFNEFDDLEFKRICCFQNKIFYNEILNILDKKLSNVFTTSVGNHHTGTHSVDMKHSIKQFLSRVGEIYIVDE